jgi:hypothetical protein
MSEILKTMFCTLWNKSESMQNLLKSKNPRTMVAAHSQPLSLENRPMSEENQLKSKNPETMAGHSQALSFENRPMSEILKTILMIPAFAALFAFLLVINGIFLRGHNKPVLIDMPRTHYLDQLYFLRNESVGISPETQTAGNYYQLANVKPISACPHLLAASGKIQNLS